MTARITKHRCVLLDANIVIEAHALEIWTDLKEKYDLVIPSIVVIDEVRYFRSSKRVSKPIRLGEEVTTGEIFQLTATVEEYAEINRVFASWFIQALDPGETEALALLRANRAPDACFCTSDGPAIKALAMLGLSDLGISMEILMKKIGLTKNLRRQFSEEFFRVNIRLGQTNRITGEGLTTRK